MPSNYTGDPTATQTPAVHPEDGVPPVVALPIDADPGNAASLYQPLKVLADYISYTQRRGISTWVSGKTYSAGDLVTWDYRIWQTQTTTTGDTPSSTSTVWGLIAGSSIEGSTTIGCIHWSGILIQFYTCNLGGGGSVTNSWYRAMTVCLGAVGTYVSSGARTVPLNITAHSGTGFTVIGDANQDVCIMAIGTRT